MNILFFIVHRIFSFEWKIREEFLLCSIDMFGALMKKIVGKMWYTKQKRLFTGIVMNESLSIII